MLGRLLNCHPNFNCLYGSLARSVTKPLLAEKFPYGFKNLVKLGVRIFFFFKITAAKTIFGFSSKTLRKKPLSR